MLPRYAAALLCAWLLACPHNGCGAEVSRGGAPPRGGAPRRRHHKQAPAVHQSGAQPLLPSSQPLVPVQAASVAAAAGDETFKIGNTFFNTVSNFTSTGFASWRGHTLSVTNGVTGYWIEGRFSVPFAVAAWLVIGYSTPSYLMGSNDGSTFTNISLVSTDHPACNATFVPCVYAVAPLPSLPTFSVYRLVTPASEYDYVVTLFTLQSSAAAIPPSNSTTASSLSARTRQKPYMGWRDWAVYGNIHQARLWFGQKIKTEKKRLN